MSDLRYEIIEEEGSWGVFFFVYDVEGIVPAHSVQAEPGVLWETHIELLEALGYPDAKEVVYGAVNELKARGLLSTAYFAFEWLGFDAVV
jgi:hypothetical protein